ncbi:type 1 glutamine amidotransferase, partial [Paracoccaceae bacterium]|nr:type 1 glutamine amidotransferase [Paracoccaceae bacterium]
DGLPERMHCLQWHGAEIKTLPAGAKVLATSPDCAVQAMSWGPRAYSLQFHIEIEQSTVQDWSKIPEYETSLTAALGVNGQKTLEADCAAHMHAFNAMAERLYLNWLQTAARA